MSPSPIHSTSRVNENLRVWEVMVSEYVNERCS